MNISDSAISINIETVEGQPMYFASAKVDGRLYQGYARTEREAKYNLCQQVPDEAHRKHQSER